MLHVALFFTHLNPVRRLLLSGESSANSCFRFSTNYHLCYFGWDQICVLLRRRRMCFKRELKRSELNQPDWSLMCLQAQVWFRRGFYQISWILLHQDKQCDSTLTVPCSSSHSSSARNAPPATFTDRKLCLLCDHMIPTVHGHGSMPCLCWGSLHLCRSSSVC